jgi:hypothetical protein
MENIPKTITLSWNEQFNKVKDYIEKNHKFPVSTDKEN